MISAALKSAWINIKSDHGQIIISIFGLGIALAITILIFLYSSEELSYDDEFGNSDRIVLISQKTRGNSLYISEYSSAMVEETFSDKFPAISNIAKVRYLNLDMVQYAQRQFDIGVVLAADDSFLDVFDFDWKHGDPIQALEMPNSIVLNDSTAIRIFGSPSEALGKAISLPDGLQMNVTGVIGGLRRNTHFQDFSGIVNYGLQGRASWSSSTFLTYALLAESSDADTLQQEVSDWAAAEFDIGERGYEFKVTPLRSIHLERNATGLIPDRILRLKILATLAIVVTLVAIFNYVNLATANATRRCLRIGLNKVFGGTSIQVAIAAIFESVIVTGVSMFLSWAIIEILLPYLNIALGYNLSTAMLFEPIGVAFLLGSVVFLSLMSSGCSAVILNSTSITKALRKSWDVGKGGALLKSGILVSQLTISSILILFTYIFLAQIKYMDSYELGFKTDNILAASVGPWIGPMSEQRWAAFRNELINTASVFDAVHSTSTPLMERLMTSSVESPSVTGPVQLNVLTADPSYLRFYDIDLIAGRNFDPRHQFSAGNLGELFGDEVIINAEAAKALGWSPNEAVGRSIFVPGPIGGEVQAVPVIGVVEDAPASLRKGAMPIIYVAANIPNFQLLGGSISIDTGESEDSDSLAAVLEVFERNFPDQQIEVSYIDSKVRAQYESEHNDAWLFSLITIFSIGVSIFGLVSIVVNSSKCRVKEVAIRKVFGGSNTDVMQLFLSEYLFLMIFATALSMPLGGYFSYQWLRTFAQQVDLNWISITGILVGEFLLVACITTIAVRGALSTNPARVLAVSS